MSWRTAKGRAGKRHVKKIEWTETAIPRPASRAIAARATPMVLVPALHRRKNYRTGGLLGVEQKCVDQHIVITTISNTWAGGEMDPVAQLCIGASVQGTGLSNRDGQRVVFKSVWIEGYVQRAVTSDAPDVRAPSIVTIALVQDTQTNGAQLNAENVYSDAGTDALSRRLIENTQRFKVLKKWVFTMCDTIAFNDAATTGSVAAAPKRFSCFKKMNMPVSFVSGAGAGTVADIRDNSLHIIACSTGTVDSMVYNVRTRFVG